jgi:DNA repair photolyase
MTAKYANLIWSRMPLRLGSMTDCFSEFERQHRLTYRLLSTLSRYCYPYLILTKSALVAEDDYLEVLNSDIAYVQVTITTPYDDQAAVYEPGASSTTERLEAVKRLADAGFYVAVRINPMFPVYPDGYYTRGREPDAEAFRYFDWSLLDMAAEAGAKTIIAGFVRLGSANMRWIREGTGRDLARLFDPKTKHANTALHFSREEKRWYYERAKHECDRLGVEFSVCYDGDDDYEAFRYLWANPDDCCNASGKLKWFVNKWNVQH